MLGIKVSEVVQVGDNFLVRFYHNSCGETSLGHWESYNCSNCGDRAGDYLILPKVRWNYRLVCGSLRKSRGGINKRQIRTLKEIQGNCCAYCDKPLEEYHVDHVIPFSVGGTNNISNLVLACPRCNLKASSNCFESFYSKKLFVMEAIKNERC